MDFISGIFDAMDARRRRRNRETAFVFGCGCLGFIVLGIIMFIVVSVMNTIETASVRTTYGETYAVSCQAPSGSDDMDNFPDSESPRQILLMVTETQRRHRWHQDLPAQWQASNRNEVGLIGCIEEDSTTIETCEYQRTSEEGGSFTVRVERIQYETTIILLNPETARRIDSLTIEGTEPEACPDDETVTGSRQLEGERIEFDAISQWLEPYIFDEMN